MQVYDNSPIIGYIEWEDLHIQYQGVTYDIQDGFSAARYLYWDPVVSTDTLQASNTLPSISEDGIIVFLNKDGTHVTVPKTTVVEGSLIVEESILANALAANSVTADKILAGSVTAEKIAAWDMLVGQHIQSANYDGTDVDTGDATSGFRIEADGKAEFHDVRVRGEVAATSFDGTGTSLLSAIDDTDWTFESGSGTVTKLSDNHYRISFTTTGDAVTPYIKSASSPWYSLHSIDVVYTDDPYNGNAAFGLEQENGGFYGHISLWPSIPSYHRMPINTRWDGVRFVLHGQAGCFYDVFVEAIDPAHLGGVVITESTKVIGNLDLEVDASAFGHMGHLNAAGNVAAGAEITANSNITTTGGKFMAPNGSADNPTYTFSSDADTGLYRVGANHLGIAAAGSLSASFTSNSTRFSDGTASAPGITFQSDVDTGFFRKAANEIGISLGGAQRAYWGYEAAGTGGAGGYTLHLSSGPPTTTGGVANVYCTSSRNYALFITTSKRAYKRDIRTLTEAYDVGDWFDRLRPVAFKPLEGDPGVVDCDEDIVGFVAEEVDEVSPLLSTKGKDGEPNGWNERSMLAALVAEVQSLRKRVADLEANVDALPGRKDHR